MASSAVMMAVASVSDVSAARVRGEELELAAPSGLASVAPPPFRGVGPLRPFFLPWGLMMVEASRPLPAAADAVEDEALVAGRGRGRTVPPLAAPETDDAACLSADTVRPPALTPTLLAGTTRARPVAVTPPELVPAPAADDADELVAAAVVVVEVGSRPMPLISNAMDAVESCCLLLEAAAAASAEVDGMRADLARVKARAAAAEGAP